MRIRSRIAETQNDICDIDMPDDPSFKGDIVQQKITSDLGKYGRAWGWQIVRPGFCMMEVNFELHKKVVDLFSIKGKHIQLSLFFEGNSVIGGRHTCAPFQLDAGLVRVSFQKDTDMEVAMQAQRHVRYITLIMSKAYYQHLMRNEPWKESDVFYKDIESDRYAFLDKGSFVINHQIQVLLAQIFDWQQVGALPEFRATYIEMKLREMFYLFHAQHYSQKPILHNFDSDTVDALQKAKALLAANPAKPITIRELSRHVLLNEQKLKQGFRTLFSATIYGYVLDLRMREAARLVLNPDNSVGQISADLGYKSTSHFIAAFKKFYGQTPKQMAVQRLMIAGHV